MLQDYSDLVIWLYALLAIPGQIYYPKYLRFSLIVYYNFYYFNYSFRMFWEVIEKHGLELNNGQQICSQISHHGGTWNIKLLFLYIAVYLKRYCLESYKPSLNYSLVHFSDLGFLHQPYISKLIL